MRCPSPRDDAISSCTALSIWESLALAALKGLSPISVGPSLSSRGRKNGCLLLAV